MANIKLYLDTRSADAANCCPLKLAINHNSKSAYIGLNIRICPTQWDKATQRVTNHTQRLQLNQHIQTMRINAENAMLQIQSERGLRSLSAVQLRDLIVSRLNGDNIEQKATIASVFAQMIADTSKAESTRATYSHVLRHLRLFDKNFDTLCFDDVNKSYIMSFYGHLLGYISLNSAKIYITKLIAVFNRAIDDSLTSNYPFRRLNLKSTETVKRSLSVEQMRALLTADLDGREAYARDMFALSFYLIGINLADLMTLKKINEYNCVEYYRHKTQRLYMIRVEKEAHEIIERYRGTSALIDLSDVYKKKINANTWLNRWLSCAVARVSAQTPMPADVTMYWARHTWATLASKIHIPEDIISRCLGHSFGSKTTKIYIDFNKSEITIANRCVIDYVLRGKISVDYALPWQL